MEVISFRKIKRISLCNYRIIYSIYRYNYISTKTNKDKAMASPPVEFCKCTCTGPVGVHVRIGIRDQIPQFAKKKTNKGHS